jgi:ankyrin repeat protein
MGACFTPDKTKGGRKKATTASGVAAADISERGDKDFNEFKSKSTQNLEKLIVDGEVGVLEVLIKNDQLKLNKPIFDSSKTALHVALQNKHRKVVELFLRYNAEVNKEELQTGNTPLFFAAADLNEDYVRLLLDNISKPDLGHKNAKGINIFEFLNNWFYKSRGRELNESERNKLNSILLMLREYKERSGSNVERLEM